jgi:hypothetical protein
MPAIAGRVDNFMKAPLQLNPLPTPQLLLPRFDAGQKWRKRSIRSLSLKDLWISVNERVKCHFCLLFVKPEHDPYWEKVVKEQVA